MLSPRRSFLVPLMLGTLVGLSACGSADEPTSAATTTPPPEVAVADDEQPAETTAVVEEPPAETTTIVEEEHDDEHGEEADHSDEHGDDTSADEEHIEEHSDEEHGDEHGDEEHDEHDDESGSLGAHEHGTAELSVAWIESEVAISLVSPTFNVFGFEYEPTTDEDLGIEADRTEALTGPGVTAINDAAACALIDPVTTKVERDGSHSEVTVSWMFECENPDEVNEVNLSGLFVEFPNFEDIDVQWISDTEQSSAELSPSAPAFTLQR